MGATYLSLQLRTVDRDAAIACLQSLAVANTSERLQFYVAEPADSWLAVFPNFTPELERTAKSVSKQLDCLVVLFLLADEDDLYVMFFRHGKQLPWFKLSIGRKRTGKEREKLEAKLLPLAKICDEETRAKLLSLLADTTDVTFMSDVLRSACEIIGIRNAFTSFDYLQRGDRDGLVMPGELLLVPT